MPALVNLVRKEAQRSDHDAVLESHTPQLQWMEELGRMRAIWLGVGGCPSGRLLKRRIVADTRGCPVHNALVCEILLFRLEDVMMVFGRHVGSVCENELLVLKG